MDGLLTHVIVGGVAGGVAVLVLVLLLPRRHCPECKTLLPRFRKPANAKQAMWGGWTCTHCGCRVDRKGKRVQD